MAVSVISLNIHSNSHSPPLHKHHKHKYVLTLLHFTKIQANSSPYTSYKNVQISQIPFFSTPESSIFPLCMILTTLFAFFAVSEPQFFYLEHPFRACIYSENKKEEVFGMYKSMLCEGSVIMPYKNRIVIGTY